MNFWQLLLISSGRTLIGAVFMMATLGDIRDYKMLLSLLDIKKVRYKTLLLPGAIALKFICGTALVLHVFSPLAAFLLAGFTLIANIIFHHFWTLTGVERKKSFTQFLSNLAIVGGLLVLSGV